MPNLPLKVEVQPWQFHEHPSSGHKIFLDMNQLTVHTLQGKMVTVEVLTLPERQWVTLRDENDQELPIRVFRDGYVARGIHSLQGRLIIEWLPASSNSQDEQGLASSGDADAETIQTQLQQAVNNSGMVNKIMIDTLRGMAGLGPKPPGFF
jgi:hypothetical protein